MLKFSALFLNSEMAQQYLKTSGITIKHLKTPQFIFLSIKKKKKKAVFPQNIFN